MPPPAILCLTVVYTLLLSLSDGAQLVANDAPVLQAEPMKSWPGLLVDVKLMNSRSPRNQYLLRAKPVVRDGGTTVLYNVNASLDSINDPHATYRSIASYVQIDGYAFVTSTGPQQPAKCVDHETFPYSIPPINGIARALMFVTDYTHSSSDVCSGKLYLIKAENEDYNVCETEPGVRLTISGNGMVLTVSYADDVEVTSNGVQALGCKQVTFPVPVTPIGKSLLTGENRRSA